MTDLISEQYDDIYFSKDNGLEETRYVFLQHNNLTERFKNADHFTIMETGFGTGLNFLATWQLFEQNAPKQAHLQYISLEKYPLEKAAIQSALTHWPEISPYLDQLIQHYPICTEGFHQINLQSPRPLRERGRVSGITLTLIIGDAKDTLPQIIGSADAWFLDGFAPSKNPDLWSNDIIQHIARFSHNKTTFATFTAASDIRKRLIAHGFDVKKDKGFGRKREMLLGQKLPLNKNSVGANLCIGPYHKPNNNLKPWFQLPWLTLSLNEKSPSSSGLTGGSRLPRRAAPRNDSIVIIGGGLAGCATAYALKRHGIQSIIIEAGNDIASGASNNPMGLLSPKLSPDNNLTDQYLTQGFLFTRQIIQQLISKGHDIAHQWCGVLHLAVNDRLKNRFEAIANRRKLPDQFAQYIDAQAASNIAGIALKHPGLWLPQAGIIKPKDLCQALFNASGAALKINMPVNRIERIDNQWQLFDNNNQLIFESQHVVIANASSANQFDITQGLPIKSVPGQLTICQDNDFSTNLKTALSYEGYCLPSINSKHLLGATYRNGDSTDLSEKMADHAYNLDLLNTAINKRADTGIGPYSVFEQKDVIDYHTAIRAVTPDHLPLIGPIADETQFKQQFAKLKHGERAVSREQVQYFPGLWVNAGHGSKGLASTLLAGEILAAQMTGKTLPISKNVYQAIHPLRFWMRTLKNP